jgi:small subunit ribosomal protein S9
MDKPAEKKSRYFGTGRRRTAVARVRLTEGSGKITINGRDLDEYFSEPEDRRAILAPLKKAADPVDVAVRVVGGGRTGQAGAAAQGIARALGIMQGHQSNRKKYGARSARKSVQFSKAGGPPVLTLGKGGKIKPADMRKAVLIVRDRWLRELD